MRYEVRWANGYWRVFDTDRYTTVSLCGLKTEAQAQVDYKNRK